MMNPSRGCCTASMDCSSLQEGNNVCAPVLREVATALLSTLHCAIKSDSIQSIVVECELVRG